MAWAARSVEQIRADLARVAVRMGEPDPLAAAELVLAKVAAGRMQVFPLAHGSVAGWLTEDGTAHLHAGSGLLDEILRAEPEICAFYARVGATRLTVSGRRGWRRVLLPRGWRLEGEQLVKELA